LIGFYSLAIIEFIIFLSHRYLLVLVIAGNTGEELAQQIVEYSNWKLLDCKIKTFPDGEKYFRFHEFPPKEEPVVIVQSMYQPQETNLFETLNIAYNLKLKGIKDITVVCPYLSYARSDREVLSGDAIGAYTVLHLLESSGVNRLVVIDIHNPEISEHVNNMKFINLIPGKSIKDFILQNHKPNETWQVLAPDQGASERAEKLAKELNIPWAALIKDRDPETGEVSTRLPKEIKLRSTVILYDDIMSSGGSMVNAMSLLKINGVETIHVVISHIMGEKAIDQLIDIGGGFVAATESVPSSISNIKLGKEIVEELKSDIS
jgi:ribose-phosphate pyrophosphokinase